MKGAIRKDQLLERVPLSEYTINQMEKNGEFPKRFPLTNRTVAWNLDEIEAWLDERQRNADNAERDPTITAKLSANKNHQKAHEVDKKVESAMLMEATKEEFKSVMRLHDKRSRRGDRMIYLSNERVIGVREYNQNNEVKYHISRSLMLDVFESLKSNAGNHSFSIPEIKQIRLSTLSQRGAV